jgi:hypothetical protein
VPDSGAGKNSKKKLRSGRIRVPEREKVEVQFRFRRQERVPIPIPIIRANKEMRGGARGKVQRKVQLEGERVITEELLKD